MAMVVQHNLTAMNANRQLGVTTGSQSKSSEKLSSGYRINRAGDDAAGLKISEKMRSQVRGLNRASTNAQDGVSLIQTAEGALNEAHSILQRMNELAVQGANDTNENIDRDAINEELAALTDELDRISETTQFNKQNLLDGSFQDKNLHVGANVNQKITISIDNMNAATLGLRTGITVGATDEVRAPGELQTGSVVDTVRYKGMEYTWDTAKSQDSNIAAAVSQFKGTVSDNANSTVGVQYVPTTNATGSMVYKDTQGGEHGEIASAVLVDVSAMKADISANVTAGNLSTYGTYKTQTATDSTVAAVGSVIQSATAGETVNAPRVDTYKIANDTLAAVQEAINRVSSQRSALGALQNRLEHTIANLDNVAENTQAAESRIRDTDMASEMVEYSKNNILAQAGQSMLAQSNQSTQGVLSLLQ